MIPQDTIDQIIDTARIEDVVGDFLTLKRRGANYVACCPFHNEKTPSFYVSPSKGIYKCFGCGKAGTAIGFVMEHEQYSYTEALRYLARKYHIEIVEEEEDAAQIEARQRRESILLASEFACKFFRDSLGTEEGRTFGYAYFKSRGMEDDTIEKFSLGWAPSSRDALLSAARAAGYKDEYLLAAGLVVQKEDGSLVDKFRERVMFPIHSVSGRVIAYSGRTLRSDNPAKYVNTAETEIYTKGRNLLGLYFAKSEINRMDKCILVEGNVDMVTMHQLGITNVVASCGTALTVEQIRLIKKFTDNILVMYDGDPAGIHAAIRGLGLILEEGMNVSIVLLPEGEDPDSYARKHTLEEVKDFISAGEKDFIGFKTDLLLGEAAGDPLKKANLINDIADTIALIPDPVKRSTYAEACAVKFGIESSIIFQRIARERDRRIQQERQSAEREERRADREDETKESPTGRETASRWSQDRRLDPVEKELVTFMVRYGSEKLEFKTDSPYYNEDGPDSVAEFIAGAFEQDGSSLNNGFYRKLYEKYLELYDSGLSQEQIVSRLMNSQDRDIAALTSELITEKHLLSVEKFKSSMSTLSYRLAKYVPETICQYAVKRLESIVDEIMRKMKAGEGDQDALVVEYAGRKRDLEALKKKLKETEK